jgi:hypothetical protein
MNKITKSAANLLPDLLEAVDDRDTGYGVDPREGLETNRGQVVLARDLAEVNDGLRRRVHAQHAVATCLVNLKKTKSDLLFNLFSFIDYGAFYWHQDISDQ